MFGGEEEGRGRGISLGVAAGGSFSCSGKAASLHSRMKEQCLIRADIYNNQPYFNFAKFLEEKRKDVDGEHRWELQLVDPSRLLSFSFYIY